MIPKIRVSSQLHLFVLGVAIVVPLLTSAAIILFRLWSIEYSRSEQLAEQFAIQTEGVVAGQLERGLSLLDGLAASTSLSKNDLASFYIEAKKVAGHEGGIVLLRGLGTQHILNTQAPFETQLPPAIQLTAEERNQYLSGKIVISNIYESPLSGELRFAITRPLPDKELLLSITYPTTRIRDALRSVTPPNWITTVGDRSGVILARSERHDEITGRPANPVYLQKAVGKSGSFRTSNFEGTPIVTGFVHSTLSGWLIGANITEAKISEPFRRFLLFFIASAVVALSLSILLAYAIGRMFASATHQLTQQAVALEEGRPVGPITTHLTDLARIGDALTKASAGVRQRERDRRLLTNELNHRVKNTLATIQGIAYQTFRGDRAVAEMRDTLSSRLVALSKAHDVLTSNSWEPAEIKEIVQSVVDGFGGEERISVKLGPFVRLRPTASIALSLALHELATNAVKYGALANDNGFIDITWSIVEKTHVELRWIERGGPVVSPPLQKGFGSRLIESAFSDTPGARVSLTFPECGVTCTIAIPTEMVVFDHDVLADATEGGRPTR